MAFSEERLYYLAHEGFIRRAAALGGPFMLKGSYITRQFFDDPTVRRAGDLDWTYLGGRLDGVAEARQVFDEWATRVTELELPEEDGVVFTSFQEDAFWRQIDYAMADDFPTIDTDLECEVHGEPCRFNMDVTFNLPMGVPSVPLLYQPTEGPSFWLPHTTPLSLQVAWKLHQSLVRPRFKDLFDLRYLLRHPAFDAATRQQTLASLAEECAADRVDLTRLDNLVAGDLATLFLDRCLYDPILYWNKPKAEVSGVAPELLADAWQCWCSADDDLRRFSVYTLERARWFTDITRLPATLAGFEQSLREAFAQAGFVPSGPLRPAPLLIRYP